MSRRIPLVTGTWIGHDPKQFTRLVHGQIAIYGGGAVEVDGVKIGTRHPLREMVMDGVFQGAAVRVRVIVDLIKGNPIGRLQ